MGLVMRCSSAPSHWPGLVLRLYNLWSEDVLKVSTDADDGDYNFTSLFGDEPPQSSADEDEDSTGGFEVGGEDSAHLGVGVEQTSQLVSSCADTTPRIQVLSCDVCKCTSEDSRTLSKA